MNIHQPQAFAFFISCWLCLLSALMVQDTTNCVLLFVAGLAAGMNGLIALYFASKRNSQTMQCKSTDDAEQLVHHHSQMNFSSLHDTDRDSFNDDA